MKRFCFLKTLSLAFAGAMVVGGLAGCSSTGGGGGDTPAEKQYTIKFLNYVVGGLAGCPSTGGGGGDTPAEKQYTIKFLNYDDSLLLETKAKEGAMPVYTGDAPKRPGDAQYTYRFSGWDPKLTAATADASYRATYTTSTNTYLVTIGDQDPVLKEYGSKLDKPKSPEDYILGEYFFAFDGWEVDSSGVLWNFDTDVVKKDTVLTAHYVKTTALNVKFYDGNGDVLYEGKSGSGLAPVYKGEKTPSKEPTIDKVYEFNGWSPSIDEKITEDTEYHPVFIESVRQYNIKFVNFDNTEIEVIPTDYGTLPVYTGQTPVRPDDGTYGYTFTGWSPEFTNVTGDATYTATYSKAPLDPAKVIINQYIDDEATPCYTDELEVPNHSTYTVDEKYHTVLGEGKDPSKYALKSTDTVDIYLIAGQSNAAGYSTVANLSTGKKDQYPETPHVTFCGEIDDRFVTDITTPVTFGLGPSINHFGPEVGMAKMIEKANPNSLSTIVKTAYGGSWLYDYRADAVSQKYGNWCSPSMRDASADPNITGKAYDAFIRNITDAVKYYKDNGTQVRLGGMLWIQGEQESGQANSSEYGEHLEALITDLRIDFSTLFDYNATTAPFVIGKISSTFAGGHLGVDNVRQCEENVAAKMSDVYALETYEIVDPATGLPKKGCYDKYHFASDDMLLIGERTATLMGEKIVPEGTGAAVNVLRKQVNGTTTFDLYFETRKGGSYNVEYYFENSDGVYQKSSYTKLVTSTEEKPFYPGDKVTVDTSEIPSEITDKPTLKPDCDWNLNQDKSFLTGFVLSDGKLTLKVYYSQKDPRDNNYTILFNEDYWKSKGLSGKAGDFAQTGSNSKAYNFTSNEWIEYTPNGWGSFVTNGAHWDAYIKNITPIKGIKKIEFQMRWNIWNYEVTDTTPYVNIYTSDNDAFVNATKIKVEMGTGTQATLGETFKLEVAGYPSFIKFDFGDNSKNTFFDSIMNLKITYCDFGKAYFYNHNVNYDASTKKAVATKLDGTGWSNFEGSYMYFGEYSDTAIVSANISHIDHDFRAYSGICFSTGEKVDSSLDDSTPRNYRSLEVGLAHNGIYSSKDHRGEKGADSPSYYPSLGTPLGTTGKLTIVIKNNKVYYYIDDVFSTSKGLTEAYSGGFAEGDKFMFGVWFANYFNTSRSVTIVDEIYGSEAVEAEIASNPVYTNLR